ncbi:MAG: DUF6079 family protein [Enterococcus casseliflavus]
MILLYNSGYKIWSYELPWEQRRVMRKGYLFLGSPNERSTAQPERDFYIYMLRPFNIVNYKDEKRSDEVFFKLNLEDDYFEKTLRKYAAAKEQYIETTQAQKPLFKAKYDSYYKQLNKWLFEHFVDVFKVVYKGKEGYLSDFGMFLPQEDTLKAMVNYASAEFLNDAFQEKYPDYPTFKEYKPGYLTNDNIKTSASDALQFLNGRSTKTGEAILNGLVMEDSTGKVTAESISNSGFSRWILEMLEEKGNGKVVNNKEIYDQDALRGTGDRRLSKEFKLEPELVVVVIGALLYAGKLEISLAGTNYTAMNYREFAAENIEVLSNFDYIKKPSGLPINEINAVLNLFDEYAPNFDEKILEGYIRRLSSKSIEEVSHTLNTIEMVKKGFSIGGTEVMDANNRQDTIMRLTSYKDFCEKVQRYNTVAKMKNFSASVTEISEQEENKKLIDSIEQMKKDVDEVGTLVTYITQATYNYGLESDWTKNAQEAINAVVEAVKKGAGFKSQMDDLKEIKEHYIDEYYDIHQKSRLTSKEEINRDALLNTVEADVLATLKANIDILPGQQLIDWVQELRATRACFSLTKAELEQYPTCTHCNFEIGKTDRNSKLVVSNGKEKLTGIYENWMEILVSTLQQGDIVENRELLNNEEKVEINQFIATKELTVPVSPQFLNTINSLFKGFEKVEITEAELVKAMGDGSPMSVNELEGRIRQLIAELTEGKEKNKVRIMFKR